MFLVKVSAVASCGWGLASMSGWGDDARPRVILCGDKDSLVLKCCQVSCPINLWISNKSSHLCFSMLNSSHFQALWAPLRWTSQIRCHWLKPLCQLERALYSDAKGLKWRSVMESAHKSKQKCLCEVQMLHQNWSTREDSCNHIWLCICTCTKVALNALNNTGLMSSNNSKCRLFSSRHTHTVENKTRFLSERCRLSSISHRYLLNSWLRPQLQISREGWKKTNDHPAAVNRNISPLWGFHFFSLIFFCYLLEKLHFWKPLLFCSRKEVKTWCWHFSSPLKFEENCLKLF